MWRSRWRKRREKKEALGVIGYCKGRGLGGHSCPLPPPTRLRINTTNDVRTERPESGPGDDPPGLWRADYFAASPEAGLCKLLSRLTLWLTGLPSEYKNGLLTAVPFPLWSSQAKTSCLCSLTHTACREKKTPVIQQFFFFFAPFTLSESSRNLSF